MYVKQYPVNLNSVSTATTLAAHDKEITSIYAEHQSIATDFAGATAPQLPVTNCRWLDTSATPPKLKRYNGATWVEEYIDHAINADNATTAGACIGNAATATKLETAITIAGTNFDGSANIDISYNSLTDKPTIPSVPSIATEAQAIAGTDNTVAITPLQLRNGLNAGGSAPIFACRAWVNFNGTGTVAIRASGNVSSITDNGTGDYIVNFATALPGSDYALVVTSGANSSAMLAGGRFDSSSPTANSANIFTANSSGTKADSAYVMVSVFR